MSCLVCCRYSLTYLKSLPVFAIAPNTLSSCVLLGRLETVKERSGSFCAWITWISAVVICAFWHQMLAPPKGCIIELLMSGSSSFTWLCDRRKGCRVLHKLNAHEKSLSAHWWDWGLWDPWPLQKGLPVTTYVLSGWSLAWSQIEFLWVFSFWCLLYRVLLCGVNRSKLSYRRWLKIQFNLCSFGGTSFGSSEMGLLISRPFVSDLSCWRLAWHRVPIAHLGAISIPGLWEDGGGCVTRSGR